ncbi:MAG: DUF1549 and DUF1553 domain-containing protein [Verrucomicrobia bacterium]|nr:DUF1549 and DUF1553 domain-containing protein [Verrucomicrobiota bacterium]
MRSSRGVRLLGIAILIGVSLLPFELGSQEPPQEKREGLAGHLIQEQPHWAFEPIRHPEIPGVRNKSWPANPIDHFVLARLESGQLAPSGEADRRTLIRRAYFDLIGLPPSFADVEAFANDASPNAFAELVDRLLARPEYGERWARHWLDVARYSDSKGYVDGGEARYPFAYTYRDYVIRAMNADVPFDRFVLEQLAADRIAETKDSSTLAALGFLTVGSRYNFFPHEIIDDRIDAVTRGFLGVSAACARCHDHKFDPISSKDYYGLYAILANSQEPTPAKALRLTAAGPAEDDEFLKKLQEASDKFEKLRSDLHQRIMHEQRAWAGDYLRYIVQSTPEHRTMAQAELRTKRGLIREVSAYSSGAVVRWRSFLASRKSDDPVFGLWTRIGGLQRDEISTRAALELEAWQKSSLANPIVAAAFSGKSVSSMADVADIYGELLEETEAQWQTQLEETPGATAFNNVDREQLRQALYEPDAPGTITLDQSEDCYTLDESVDVRKHFADIERVFLEAWDGVAPRPMSMADRPDPIEQRVFLRGDPQRLGERVDHRIPSMLSRFGLEPVSNGSGRLELARAIVHPENPLAARVIVNRVWAWHFGSGLVDSPSDFGMRSSPPSHPELLDFLANVLKDNGWSIKELHRLILLSNTWRQASIDRPDCRAADPENRLLWRANRRRLDFEAMRDSMLAISGNLARAHGGPPVRKAPDDQSNQRRAIYTYLDREHVPEICGVFDFPNPDITAPKRSRTTVPQQSLFLLNSPFVIAQADAIVRGSESMASSNPDSWQITECVVRIFRLIYARAPIEEELILAREFFSERFTRSDGGVAKERVNPWTEFAQALILSNEFLFVD